MVATVFELAGFAVKQSGDYPGWKPEPASDIVRKARAVHQEVSQPPSSSLCTRVSSVASSARSTPGCR